MRISDWRSDVCSSDLRIHLIPPDRVPVHQRMSHKLQGAKRGKDRVDIDSQLGLALLDLIAATQPRHLVQDREDVFTAKRDSFIRSEEHTSELQSLMRISYAVFCLKKKILYLSISNLHKVVTRISLYTINN